MPVLFGIGLRFGFYGLRVVDSMSRSEKKGPFVSEPLFRKVMNAKSSGASMAIRTWARSCTIVPEFIGHRFEVHNGKVFHPVYVTEDMVGHKLGEFSGTRLFRGHTNKKEGIKVR
jgi:small subunit ribosomal protein S19